MLKDVSSWSPSLWTLQEGFLQPDMLLCNSSFAVLTASEGFYVTFDMVKALVDALDGLGDSLAGGSPHHPLIIAVRSSRELSSFFASLWPSAPQTVLTLRSFCNQTGLWDGIRSSPAMVLRLASSRSSLGRRAEAIMSVVGAIDWYQSEGAAGIPPTHDLVFEMYPFAFVSEVQNKIGGTFFLSDDLNWSGEDLKWPDTGDLADQNPLLKGITLGTMLPLSPVTFSPSVSFERLRDELWEAASDKGRVEIDATRDFAMLSSKCPGYSEHPAVKTWTLCPNGNVLIASAAIEFSSLDSEKKQSNYGESASHEVWTERDRLEVIPPRYTFRALDFTRVTMIPKRIEKSLEAFGFPGVKHAVCVAEFSDNDYLHRAGVILGGQYAKSSNHYVRIGYYDGTIPLKAKEARPVPSQKVDWIVL